MYDQFYSAATDRDTDKLLKLFCPGLRSQIDPPGWFGDASELPEPSDIQSRIVAPRDGGQDEPTATQWRDLSQPDGHGPSIRIAKVGTDWYVCET